METIYGILGIVAILFEAAFIIAFTFVLTKKVIKICKALTEQRKTNREAKTRFIWSNIRYKI